MYGVDVEAVGLEALSRALSDWPLIERVTLESQGKVFQKTLEANLRAQKFDGPKAKLATIKRKLAKGSNYPTDVWRDDGVLQESVDLRWDDSEGVGVGWFEDQVLADRIAAARALEWGSITKRIAARPLVRPTIAQVEPIAERQGQIVLGGIFKDLNEGRYKGVPTI